MKQPVVLICSITILGLLGCSNSISDKNSIPNNNLPNANPEQNIKPENLSFPIKVGTFTTDELFNAGGGGCGMSLWESETNPQQDGFLFFKGLEDAPAFMVFDGKMTNLSRTDASGKEFYGQQTKQVFVTEDQAIALEVEVNLGQEGEIESFEIPNGAISVKTQAKIQKFSAIGNAGC